MILLLALAIFLFLIDEPFAGCIVLGFWILL